MKYTYTHSATTITTTNMLGLSHSVLFYKIQDNLGASITICFYQVCHWLATDASCGRKSPSSPSKLFFPFISIITSLQLYLQLSIFILCQNFLQHIHTHTQLNKPTCLLGHDGRKIFYK